MRHFEWRARLDFDAKVLVGSVRLLLARDNGSTIASSADSPLDLDLRELTLERIHDDDGNALSYETSAPHPFLGQRLRVMVPANVDAVTIEYRTLPSSPALHWSTQFVYTQCQPIFARALLPLPDSPSSRVTWRASLTTPRRDGWTALMAAALIDRQVDGDVEISTWEMVEPIPPYLIALACGELSPSTISPRVQVWAPPALAADARKEFAGVEQMIVAAESLFGPYRWQRFDLLVMPRSFPHGGMENPRLAFVSPSLLTGDGSLLHVVAHELAHAWTGNLVSNASLEHFWINEGFTVYAERRILELVDGREVAELHAALGRRDLDRALAAFAAQPELTRLRTSLDGIDPEDALSIVPYEKGYLFVRALEAAMGREQLDRFLRAMVERFALQSIDSETLRAYAEPLVKQWFNQFEQWLNQSNLPSSTPPLREPPGLTVAAGELPAREVASAWSALEWRWLLDALPRPFAQVQTLDQWFNLSRAANPDVRAAWLALAIESDHAVDATLLDAALSSGRLKELRPLYLALARNPSTRERAGALYRRHRAGYHPAARRQLERLLRDFGIAAHEVNALSLGRRRRD